MVASPLPSFIFRTSSLFLIALTSCAQPHITSAVRARDSVGVVENYELESRKAFEETRVICAQIRRDYAQLRETQYRLEQIADKVEAETFALK